MGTTTITEIITVMTTEAITISDRWLRCLSAMEVTSVRP
jgi:hypothetical protein